jgi:hypothetical protein
MTDRNIEDIAVSVENTVVSWEHNTQINPVSGEVYDFHGNLLVPAVKEK